MTVFKIAARIGLLGLFGIAGVNAADAQISFSGSYAENFNSMGALLALPTGWVTASGATPTFAGGTTSVTQQASSGSPTAGGTYNFGTSASERAIGSMTSGSFTSPRSYIVRFSNDLGATLTDLNVSYDLERYRVNTAAASVQFFTSTDGIAWTAAGAGALDVTTSELPTGTSSYTFGSPLTINKSASLSGLSVASGASFYLRVNMNTTGSNSQGIAIDNFTVSIPEPSTVALLGLTLLPGAALLRRRRK